MNKRAHRECPHPRDRVRVTEIGNWETQHSIGADGTLWHNNEPTGYHTIRVECKDCGWHKRFDYTKAPARWHELIADLCRFEDGEKYIAEEVKANG